jgi:hypothetical protein
MGKGRDISVLEMKSCHFHEAALGKEVRINYLYAGK